MRIRWESGFEIRTEVHDGEVTITANRAGLRSLANILFDLAEAQPGDHVHLDEFNSLEDGSAELVVVHAGEVSRTNATRGASGS